LGHIHPIRLIPQSGQRASDGRRERLVLVYRLWLISLESVRCPFATDPEFFDRASVIAFLLKPSGRDAADAGGQG
jgi:hypothetical protein